MAITLAVGTQVFIASTYGAAKTMSALTNATEAVATLEAAHGIAVGEFFEVTSGWQRLTNRIVRAGGVAVNDVTMEDIDTSSTSRYPSGTGTGSVREITAWTQIGQITRDIQTSGGDQQYADVTTLEDVLDQQIPTRRSPISVTLPLYFDASQGFVSVVRTASETATLTAVKFVYPSGAILVANAYWSIQDVPTVEDSTLRSKIDLTFRGLTTLYTS